MTNNLSEFSTSYYQEADIYKIFSEAEDKEEHIWSFLKPYFSNMNVLDLGCGNGIYLNKIKNVTQNYIGLDQSFFQIKQSKQSHPFVVGDGSKLPFGNNNFDIILSCWVWGTILDINKRKLVLEEALRTLKHKGSIFLIENDINSEFEFLRGRHLNGETEKYNSWIISNRFSPIKKMKINITFDSIEIAQYVFRNIWKDRLFSTPKNQTIKSNIIIFELKKI